MSTLQFDDASISILSQATIELTESACQLAKSENALMDTYRASGRNLGSHSESIESLFRFLIDSDANERLFKLPISLCDTLIQMQTQLEARRKCPAESENLPPEDLL